MIPNKLTLRNFMCYRDDVPPLLFDGIHIACLSGDNGAGKSTLLDAMTWALWGKARAKSDDELIALGTDDMEVNFEFELEGTVYRVLRRRTRGKRSSTGLVELQVLTGDGTWRRLSGDSMRDTDAQITDLLRMSYTTFTNSAFLLQGHADQFTSSTPQQRKQVLSDIIGLSDYDQLERRAKARRDRAHGKLRELEGVIEEWDQRVRQRPLIEQALHSAQAEVCQAQTAADEADSTASVLRERLQRLERIAQQRLDQAATLTGAVQAQADLVGTIDDLRLHVERAEAIVARQDAILAEVAELQRQTVALAEMERRRELAYQLKDRWQVHRDIVQAERAKLDGQLDRVTTEIRDLQAEADAEAERTAALEAVQREVALLEDLKAEITRLRAEELALLDRQSERERLTSKEQRAAMEVDQVRTTLEQLQTSLEQSIEQYAPLVAALPQIERDLDDVSRKLSYLDTRAGVRSDKARELSTVEREESRLREQLMTTTARGKEIKQKLALVHHGDGTCPLCRQPLAEAERASVAATYEAEQQDLRHQFRVTTARADELAGQIRQLESEIAGLDAELAARTALEQQRGTLMTRREQSLQARDHLATDRVQHDIYTHQLGSGEYALAEQAKLAELRAALAVLPTAQTISQDLRKLRSTIKAREAQRDQGHDVIRRQMAAEASVAASRKARDRLATLEADRATLDARIAAEDYAHEARAARDAVRRDIEALGFTPQAYEELAAIVARLRPAELQQMELERALVDLDRNREQLKRDVELRDRRALEIDTLTAKLAELDRQLTEQRQVQLDLREAEAALKVARENLSRLQRYLGSVEADLHQCDETRAQLDIKRREAAAVKQEHGLYSELAEAFGKKGIQAMLIDHAIPEIEREANLLLNRISNGNLHVALETQRDSKKGDTIETLDILISDSLGRRDYALYSGGEAFRVNFALRIALSKLLAHRAGASLKTLVIDEGFGTQDGAGRERVVEAINAISNEFARVLVITHIQELTDQFPLQIAIVKGARGSSWRIA